VLSYPSTISLSSRALNHLADHIRSHRKQQRSRWRRLNPGRQALLALAHLRNGDTYTRLAAGFEIGIATAWCYVHKAIALLSAGRRRPAHRHATHPGNWRTRSWTARSSRSAGSQTRSPTTPASTSATA
jgi:hypothetical protein